MKRRIFWSILLTSFLVVSLTVTLLITAIYRDFAEERKMELRTEADYIVRAYEGKDIAYLQNIGRDSKNRITLIDATGTVLYDSFASAASLDNHLDRPEFVQALTNGVGESVRASDTLASKTYYYAIKLEDGTVLRVAASMKSVAKIIDNSATTIGLIVLLALLLAVVAARLLTKAVVQPINQLNLEHPLLVESYDELAPLLLRMEKQREQIALQVHELEQKQREFTEITENMSEILIVFSADRRVLTANRSAGQLFGSSKLEKYSYAELCRDNAYLRAAATAFEGINAQSRLMRRGRNYQLSFNPVSGRDGFAMVLLGVDITEKEQAEQSRREFSANVSHELKTPLTSIMGYAEIMQNGIAKEEDLRCFAAQIYDESKRLLTLIEDIIKLSMLDEGDIKEKFKSVDLYVLAEKVRQELEQKAQQKQVTLQLSGEHLMVMGLEATLHEMLYNLCDNAVSYNHIGGSVKVSLFQQNGDILLKVSDTGIGIKPEEQTRIFERFYRVDKSRSKDTGGTGLGLSIVKHGATLHHAKLKLESVFGEGTEITLVFSSCTA